MLKGEEKLNNVLYRKLFGLLAFSFVFSFILMNTVDALVYLGQSYSGWGMFGYGFDDIVSLYYMYPGWIDFFIFFGIFLSLGKAVFGQKFEGGAGKGLALSIGVALSLGLVLFESNTGIYLLAESAMIVFFLASVGVFYGLFVLLHKKMDLNKAISFFVSLIATYFMWLLITSYTGLGTLDFIDFGFNNLNMGGPLSLMLWLIFAYAIVKLLILLFGSAGDSKGKGFSWPNWLKPWKWRKGKKKKGKDPKVPEIITNQTTSDVPVVTTEINFEDLKEDPEKKMDEGRLKRIEALLKYIIDNIGKDDAKIKQLLARLQALIATIQSSGELTNEAANLTNELNKIVKALRDIQKTLNGNRTPFDGLESMKSYFEGLLRGLNQIIGKLNGVKELKIHISGVNSSEGQILELLEKLKKAIKALKSGSKPYYGDIGQWTINQYWKIIINLKEKPQPIPVPQPIVERKRGINDLKQKYVAYSYELFRKRKKAGTPEEADKIRNRIMRMLSVFDKIIKMAEKQGVSKEVFLSNKYGNTNSQAPEAYYAKIIEQMKRDCQPLYRELVMQVHPDKSPNNKFKEVYTQMFKAVVKANSEGNLGDLMRLKNKIAKFMSEYGGRRALGP